MKCVSFTYSCCASCESINHPYLLHGLLWWVDELLGPSSSYESSEILDDLRDVKLRGELIRSLSIRFTVRVNTVDLECIAFVCASGLKVY